MTDSAEDTLTAEPAVADTSPEESEHPSATPEADETQTQTTDEADATAESDTESDPSEDEKQKGYLRQEDYTRKTQEISEARKALDAQRAEFERARDTRLQQADQAIQLAASALQFDYQKIDWNTLAATDPAEYVRQQHAFSQRTQQLQQAYLALQQQQQEKDRETQAQKAKRIAEQESALLEAIPEWRDPAKRAAETNEFVSLARKSSVSDNELEWISENGSAGLVSLLRDGMRYRAVQKQLPKPKPVPQAPPPPPAVKTKAPVAKDPEKMTTDEWLKWREAQIRRKSGR